jgi:hypothetical protein
MKTPYWIRSQTSPVPLATSLIVALLALPAAVTTSAQTSPARGPIPVAAQMPMEDYLGLLRQIAPAAEMGARQYLAAIRLKCSRNLGSSELRLALSKDSGDPQLLELIRASHLRDEAGRERAMRQIRCPQGSAP